MTTRLRSRSVAALAVLALLMTACSGPPAASQADALGDVYTAVALTVSGATASAAPSTTPTPVATATVMPFAVSPSPSATGTSGVAYIYASGCNNAAYVSDVTVADGEDMAPGETFTKTWELLNTGSCAWTTSYSVVFVSGSDLEAASSSLDASVAVGAYGNVSVELTAPEAEGTYTSYWRLADASGSSFGEQVYVQIVVSAEAATLTPTPTTSTDTPSPTATSTSTTEPATASPEPTATTESTSTSAPEGITSSPTQADQHVKQIRT